MLIYNSRLLGSQILSVQAAGPIAYIDASIIDPDSLKIIAFRLAGPLVAKSSANFLMTSSIREHSELGCVIDSIDELVEPTDVIKLNKILELNFDLLNLKVETKKGSKLGKIIDFTITNDNFTIEQLVVKRPLVKSFLDPELVIPRREIVEITDYKVIVKDEEKTIKARAMKEDFVPNFVNPFRTTTEPAPAHIDKSESTTEGPASEDS
ncbi:PRC-barrel domain-containing protein [Candidatus Saccharibacteria bacterium]|nr:PRC-barrel domain-containing protein [Candidatus Saccharibacteria bacterium]